MARSPRLLVFLSGVWFIAAAALGTRLAFAWDQQRKIPHRVLATLPFDQEAGNTAFALSQGHGFSNLFRQNTGPTAWLAPLYPFLLSLIFRLFGPFTISSFFVAVLLNSLFSSAATFPLFGLARRVAGRAAAIVASWLWVFLPAGILMPFEWIWDTSFSVLLATTILWLTLRVSESASRWLWSAYGILWAVALLTNPALAVVLPFLWLWAATRARDVAHISRLEPLIAIALIILFCLPWTIRNYATFHHLIPMRSSLAFELWIGNNDIFDPHAVGGVQRITRYEEIRLYAQLGENAYLAEKFNLASSFIHHNPALFLQLTGRKIIATWLGTEHPVADFLRADSLLPRVVIGCNFLLTLGTILGVWFFAHMKSPWTFPVAIFPLLYPFLYYVTHTSLRYRHPIDPILLLLAVSAAVGFSRKARVQASATPPFAKTI